MNEPKTAATPVRLDASMRDWLKHRAIDNRRTLSNEIAFRLAESRRREEIVQAEEQRS